MRPLLKPTCIFLLSAVLAWTCSCVAGSPTPAQTVLAFSQASVTVASVWWSRLVPFEAAWAVILSAQEKGKEMAESVLLDVAQEYRDIADKIHPFQEHLYNIVERSKELKTKLSESEIDIAVVHEYMVQEAANVVEVIQKEFDKPLPEDLDERARYRYEMISRALDHLENGFVGVCVKSERLSEEEARPIFAPIKQTILDALVIAGNIIDRHPVLVSQIIITAVCIVFPFELLILRPILGVFGFGPTGVLKGSAAAAMQRLFFGGAVPKGSWFSLFQRAGMVSGLAKLRALLAGIMAWF